MHPRPSLPQCAVRSSADQGGERLAGTPIGDRHPRRAHPGHGVAGQAGDREPHGGAERDGVGDHAVARRRQRPRGSASAEALGAGGVRAAGRRAARAARAARRRRRAIGRPGRRTSEPSIPRTATARSAPSSASAPSRRSRVRRRACGRRRSGARRSSRRASRPSGPGRAGRSRRAARASALPAGQRRAGVDDRDAGALEHRAPTRRASGRAGPPSAASTSAGVDAVLGPERRRRSAVTTPAPAGRGAATAAASERCGAVGDAVVGAARTRPAGGRSARVAAARARRAAPARRPASSSGVSPLTRIADQERARLRVGDLAVEQRRRRLARLVERQVARLPRGPVPTALIVARKPA